MAIQSIEILQYGQEELQDFLTAQAERNPMIRLADATPAPAQPDRNRLRASLSGSGGRSYAELPDIGETHAMPVDLRSHLEYQAQLSFRDPADRGFASEIIGSLDADGYLRRSLAEIAEFNLTTEERLLPILRQIQQFEPTGVAARNLAECMRLQLIERAELTPVMEVLLANLSLVASHEIERLARLCRLSPDAVMVLIRGLKRLNPAPGRQYDCDPVMPALPDVLVNELAPGHFAVELNPELLPRILIDRAYYSEVTALKTLDRPTRRYLTDCYRAATWLSRNLDLRAQTLLKVATELVRQQSGFFSHGPEAMRPLQLKTIADEIGVHESTVSRAISNKYLMTPRGQYPMKFFFSERLGVEGTTEGIAATAIRHRIAQMIRDERPDAILSDEAIVESLTRDGIEIARRTVAKYRMMQKIPTSSVRRRQKRH